jgi:hypothetical protein
MQTNALAHERVDGDVSALVTAAATGSKQRAKEPKTKELNRQFLAGRINEAVGGATRKRRSNQSFQGRKELIHVG